MIKVRFNLGRGDNYMKWKIEFPDDREPIYLDPDKVQLELVEAKLSNREASAKKIHEGANKFPCAWVHCKDVLIANGREVDLNREVSYNPRVKPHWMYKGVKADNMKFFSLVTKGKKIFVLNN